MTKTARRPATITRISDGKVFTYVHAWVYEAGRERISMSEAMQIIAEGDNNYLLSKEEAPNHTLPPRPTVVLHRGGLFHPPAGGNTGRHR